MKHFDQIMPQVAEKRKQQSDEQKKKRDRKRQVLNACFSTPVGMEALKIIKDLCGYQTKNAYFVDHELMKDALIYREANRELYLSLREYVNNETLKLVENEK